MDLLSDLLGVVRLRGAHFYKVEAATPWSVGTPHATKLNPRILPSAEHLIPYHIVTDGRCYGGLVGEDPVELSAGDVLVFPHGDGHALTNLPGRLSRAEVQITAATPHLQTVRLGNGRRRTCGLICGYLGCDLGPFNPLLSALPKTLAVHGIASPWVGAFTRQLTEEHRQGRPGADTVVTRLAELMFLEVLRYHLEHLPEGHKGFLAGLRDDIVGRALVSLHERPGHPWTMEALAKEAATSRSNLAKRFTDMVGQPPMQYLARWRMQVAANRLAESDMKIAAIAEAVGYDSEAAFSRAFKRNTGMAPGLWRER